MKGFSTISTLTTVLLLAGQQAVSALRTCPVKHNGKDDSPAIMDAFEKCKSNGRVVFLKNHEYTLGDVIVTPELNNVEIVFDGSLTYPFNMAYNDTTPPVPGAVQGVSAFFTIQGSNVKVIGNGGQIYGTGEEWWHLDPLPSNRPVMMAFMVNQLDVRSMKMINSPNWNFYVHRSKDVKFEDIFIEDVDNKYGEKPHNTDGWDTSEVDGITIINSHINNSDDCVAIKTNTSNIHIENLYCNGSHGISVGSLGNIPELPDYVSNMVVKNVTCENCQNGARIKTWPRSSLGYVKNVSYIDFHVTNSDNPIQIDQCYFNIEEAECLADPAKLQISNLLFKNVTGGGSKKAGQAMAYIVCSAEAPCEDFTFDGVDLVPYDGSKPVYLCQNLANNATAGLDCTPANEWED
ncbi:pectin lyase fold/virulence factor [Phascolomyces articulosus]|uniref:Pectin lyase fold/virulence factor n=1 Tax=Phascolomyces articulosus TaxID=60185 RepID=A0AAD5PD28_9FUNG|nr:pectin lyase fold/virulence factor [Phascolomyces articulosus]